MTAQELSKRLKAEYRKRVNLVNMQQEKLLRLIAFTEDKLVNLVIDELIAELAGKDGVTDFRNDAAKFSAVLDKVYDTFLKNENVKIVNQIANDFNSLLTLNENYYSLLSVNKNRFNSVKKAVREVMLERLGIKPDGTLIKRGYLDSLFRDVTLREKIKQITFKSVAAQKPFKDYVKLLRTTISGAENLDGYLTKYYKGFAFDTYQQFDRVTNDEYAKELDLSAFIYDGGLIESSRNFCIKRNGKVFTTQEANKWIDDPELPKTKEEKESGVVIYNPIYDMGRFNCRHMVRFISNELAVMLRPELKSRIAV